MSLGSGLRFRKPPRQSRSSPGPLSLGWLVAEAKRFQASGHHVPRSGSLSPRFPPQEMLILIPLQSCLPELRANCFFMPQGVSPKFFVSVSMWQPRTAALYFLGIQDGVGTWAMGNKTKFLLAGTFPCPTPSSPWSPAPPQGA